MTPYIPTFKETPSDQVIHEIASPIIAVRNGQEEIVSGTAFVIGQGIAITAYHVIADFVERYEGIRDVESYLNISFEILLFLSLNQAKDVLPIKVLRLWSSKPLDIAILALGVPDGWPDNYVWKTPQLNLLPPKVGERIAAFGFALSDVRHNEGEPHPTIDLHPRTSTGIVSQIHHQARDSSRMPFPCFQTNARFDGGMSGGPVFDSSGSVCGIICSNLPPTDEDEEHISYASTLWPIAGIAVDAGEKSFSTGIYYPFMQVLQSGAVSAKDLENVSVERGTGDLWSPMATYDAKAWEEKTV